MYNNKIQFKEKTFYFSKKYLNANIKNLFFFKKLKINLTGKIFKWLFSFNKIKFGVHFSHETSLFFNFKNFFFKKIDKKNIMFYIFQIPKMKHLYRMKKKFRYIDIFNNRGIKFNTLFIYKKRGKVSRYM